MIGSTSEGSTITFLPSQGKIGTVIKIISCNKLTINIDNIVQPDEVEVLIPGVWALIDRGINYSTYELHFKDEDELANEQYERDRKHAEETADDYKYSERFIP